MCECWGLKLASVCVKDCCGPLAHILARPALQVYTVDNVPECVEKVGFPMIIKPTSGAGSMGVYKVEDEVELKERVQQLLSEQSGDGHSNSWIYQYDAGVQVRREC